MHLVDFSAESFPLPGIHPADVPYQAERPVAVRNRTVADGGASIPAWASVSRPAMLGLGAALGRVHARQASTDSTSGQVSMIAPLRGVARNLSMAQPRLRALATELIEHLKAATPRRSDGGHDIGRFLASLRGLVLCGELSSETATQLSYAYLGGYASVRALPTPRTLGWHTAAALPREHASLVGAGRPNVPSLVDVLEEALEVLTVHED